jgi:hypothetical protein
VALERVTDVATTKPTTRVVERGSAVAEIAEAIRDRQHWIIGATPETIEYVAEVMQDSWQVIVYFDNGTPIILVGTPTTALAMTILMPIIGDASAVFIVTKTNTTAANLNAALATEMVPDDGSQDLLMFAEPLDDEHQVGYLPALLEQAAHQVDPAA